MPRLLLLDGNSLMNRAFYALPSFTTSAGTPTNAIYGFMMMLGRLHDDFHPDYWTVAFDLAAPTFRHQEFDGYKAGRKKTPDDLVVQYPILKNLLPAYGINYIEKPGFEADDLIGTAAVQGGNEGLEVFIVTGDRDALQLVTEKIKVVLTRKGISEIELYDRNKVFERFGIWPEQVPDWKGLAGDASDNIPGVPGIGDKSAVQLLQEFKSLEQILDSLDRVKKEKLRMLLETNRDIAILSKKLATIDCRAPIDVKIEQWKYKDPDLPSLRRLYQELEFNSLIAKLPADPGTETRTVKPLLLQAKSIDETPSFFTEMEKRGEVVYQYLAKGFEEPDKQLLGVALGYDEKNTVFLPYSAKNEWERWLSVLADKKIKKTCHDYKSQARFNTFFGIEPMAVDDDTMIMSYLVNANAAKHDLANASMLHLGFPFAEYGLEIKDFQMFSVNEDGKLNLLQTAGLAVALIFSLREELRKKITAWNMEELYKEVELPLTRVLIHMENNGVAVDIEFLKELSRKMSVRLQELEDKIFSYTNGRFNLNSPKQLGEILFGQLKLPVQKKTKTGYSTDADVLEGLAGEHPVIQLILQYRQLAKLKSTYTDVLPVLCAKRTGCIHTSYNQVGTATGRLSSSNPNLQNIPIRTEEGREIRKAFIVRDSGNVLFSCDYSQIELRILAHFSQDPLFCKAFLEGEDIHTYTASEIFGLSPADVTPLMRSRAKTVNFGILYGMSGFGLAKDLGISRREAEEYIASYFSKYKKVKEYLEYLVDEARKKGYAETILRRRRYLPDLNSKNNNLRSFAERTARNTPIQGSAADLIKLAMVKILPQIEAASLSARMILQVHDELVFEVGRPDLEKLKKIVVREMEGTYKLSVPIRVEAQTGINWGEMVKTEIDSVRRKNA